MVYQSGGQRIALKVGEHIRADDHCGTGLTKLADDHFKSVRAAVDVIAVELHGEASAVGAVDAEVPAAAYTRSRRGSRGGAYDLKTRV